MSGPSAELDVTAELVHDLLADQYPDLADLPIRPLASGWDNVIFRLGDEFTVRLPRRALAVPLAEHEARWLPELAPRLPLPVPAPIRHGHPGRGYPWRWTVGPWFPGSTAAETPPDDLGEAADTLGRFIAALRRPAPFDAPRNRWRGIPLRDRDGDFHLQVAKVAEAEPELARRAERTWSRLLDLPPHDGPPMWLHGDLHPANIVVHHGRISAVIDFGDLCCGDPAGDLSSGWMLLPVEHHQRFREAAGVGTQADDATWQRGRAWALTVAIAIIGSAGPFGAEPLQQVARRTLDLVLDPD